jgi:hypothetical protein
MKSTKTLSPVPRPRFANPQFGSSPTPAGAQTVVDKCRVHTGDRAVASGQPWLLRAVSLAQLARRNSGLLDDNEG